MSIDFQLFDERKASEYPFKSVDANRIQFFKMAKQYTTLPSQKIELLFQTEFFFPPVFR